MTTNWIAEFNELNELAPSDQEYLSAHCKELTLPEGQTVFAPGMEAENFLLLRSGIVKVVQISNTGREIVLYRVGSGETCILTTSCLLSRDSYSAEAITETEVAALVMPRSSFNDLLARSEGFRTFVFSNYANRISSLIHLVEEVTFERIDKRLAHKIAAMANESNPIISTHQQLATELGSAREVISRHLKEFERRGWVTVGRGQIDVINLNQLSDFAKEK